MIKKSLLTIFLLLLNFNLIDFANWAVRELWNSEIKNALIWISDTEVIWEFSKDDNWLIQLSQIFVWIKDSLTWILLLIAVATFLFIWIRLASARWNPEEFKKAMTHFVYAIIWIFIISFGWAAVTLVAWLNF